MLLAATCSSRTEEEDLFHNRLRQASADENYDDGIYCASRNHGLLNGLEHLVSPIVQKASLRSDESRS
jgi:hypothetical protein